ncbi:MAG: hypothetical protein M1832_005428 [Thelocarpon impressellum]|nr:MAG: hypothetical protein M1832_005428 [Thelocarpon impressellum]
MSYQPVFHHPSTPPYESSSSVGHSRNVSTSSFYTDDSSPDSIDTVRGALPTPVKSPIRQHGPMLLPKIRSQDQNIEPTAAAPVKRHRKALSCTQNPPGSMASRPSVLRRSTSPAGVCDLISPVSGAAVTSNMSSALSSPISMRTHSRSASASNIDTQILGKYGFPTYRQMPSYIPPATYASSTVPGASTFVPPPTYTQRAHALPADLQFGEDGSTTTLLEYLTGPNPTPALVRQLNIHAGRGAGQTHFWWDIRNLRTWGDFTVDAIEQIPGLMRLLTIELPGTALPGVLLDRGKLHPDTEAALQELCRDFYAEKVNNALKVAQGQTHMVMRADKGMFVSNYQDDVTIFGGARVVGLVKSFDRWNTGMKAEAPHRKVEYLLGLAHLHRHMRENSCRYGFIMTEIELVCVRTGTEAIPHFGLLEVAVVQLERRTGLTAGLALWYLHMLAKEMPLPGQAGWKVDVGGAAACTRQKCLPKDSWIPEPQLAERRAAKRERGWILPSDPLHRRELPRGGKKWHK